MTRNRKRYDQQGTERNTAASAGHGQAEPAGIPAGIPAAEAMPGLSQVPDGVPVPPEAEVSESCSPMEGHTEHEHDMQRRCGVVEAYGPLTLADEPPGESVPMQEPATSAVLAGIRARLGRTVCPECGSSEYWVRMSRPREDGQFQRRQCKQCGHFEEMLQPPAIPLDGR